jgi:UDPglucose 6-dehydrogenase
MNIGFIGLGKLGLACANVISKTHTVYGHDIVPKESKSISIVPIDTLIEKSDLIFIAVETPHDKIYDGSVPITHLPNKDFDYSTVKTVLTEINQYVSKDKLVILISTVLPGTVRNELIPLISNARFIYNPYLIAMGSVEWDMVNPEMVIIGTEDGDETTDAQILINFYKTIMENDPRYIIGTWDEAESIKIFYNTFISAKIGLVNMIQDVAEKNGNINVDVVTSALANSNLRIISSKYMTAGMGDAGPCHPRDNIALRYLAERLDLGYDIFDTIMSAREMQAKNLAITLVKHAKENNMDIFIHGKTYKPNVEYIDGSYSLLIGYYCKELGYNPIYIDPLTNDIVPNAYGVILLAHNQQITYNLSDKIQSLYCEIKDGSIVIDPWRMYTTDNDKIKVIHYGNTRKEK